MITRCLPVAWGSRRTAPGVGNTTLDVIKHTIGPDGNGGGNNSLLKRMANDLTANNHDNTKVNGLYWYAPDSTDLNQAFARIAGEIRRWSQKITAEAPESNLPVPSCAGRLVLF